MKKRFFALLLFSSLLFGVIFSHRAFVSAAERTLSPNIAVLNAILYGDRGWVRDTLIDDNRSTNPMRMLAGGDKISMAADALNTYRGLNAENETYAQVYRYGVNVMMLLYSPETIMNDVVDEAGNLLSWIASFFSGTDELRKFLDDMAASSDELDYDKILKEAFSKTYTASNGTTLGDTAASYLLLQGMVDSMTMLSKIEDVISADIGATDGTSELEDVYINDYVTPYTDAVEDFLSEYFSLTGTSSPDATSLTTCASLLATIVRFNRYAPEEVYTDYPYVETLNEMLLDSGISNLLKGAGKTLDISSGALENYIYIESIQRQRETLTGPIQRLASRTSNDSLKKSAANFNNLMNDQLDAKVLAYDSVLSYLRSNTVAGDTASKLITSWFKNSNLYKDGVLSSPVLAKAMTSISIGAWLGDKVTGAQNTCKKTALLLRWENLLNAALSSYYADETAYISDATDANAQKVLEDLQMIQRLRLYGERIAHELSAGQLDSWFGQLYCDAATRDAWDDVLQKNTDILLAASVVPAMSGLNVGSGQQVILSCSNDVGMYASTPKGYLVDLPSLLLGGITINGGSLLVTGSISHLGAVQTSGTATLGVTGSKLSLTELYQNSGSVNISLAAGSALHTSMLNVSNAAVTAVDGNGSITTDQLTLRGGISGVPIYVKGDISCSGATASHLELIGSDSHAISGSLSAGTFRMVSGPVQLNGNVTVTSELYGPNAVIQNPEKLLLNGGTVTGGSYPAPLTVTTANLRDTVFRSTLTDRGGTTYSGTVTVEGLLFAEGAATIQADGILRAKSAARFSNVTSTGTGRLELRSDAILSNATLSRLYIGGALPQTITGSATVDELRFENTHSKGVIITDKITVTGSLYDPYACVDQSQALTLTGNACVPDGVFSGDLTLQSWTSDTPLLIQGSATITGDGIANASLSVQGDVNVDPNAVLQNSTLHCSGVLSGPVSVDAGSALTVHGTAAFMESLLCDGPVQVRGDCAASSLTTSGACALTVSGDLSVSGTTHFRHLLLDSKLPQTISGSNFTADKLELQNTARKGVTIATDITVTEEFHPHDTIFSGNDINYHGQTEMPGTRVEWENMTVDRDTRVRGDLYINGGLSISNAVLQVDGRVYWNSGNITLTEAELLLKETLSGSGSARALTLDANSRMEVDRWTSLSGVTTTLEGTLTLGSDCRLSSAPISGAGTLYVRGDLQQSSSDVCVGALHCIGKLPQTLFGSGSFHAVDISLTNPSRKGIVFENTIYYSRTLDRGTTAVTGSDKLIPEVAQ